MSILAIMGLRNLYISKTTLACASGPRKRGKESASTSSALTSNTAPSAYVLNSGGSTNRVQVKGDTTMAKLTADQSITTSGTEQTIAWDGTRWDELGAWSGGSNTRLTVPASARLVRVTAGATWDTSVVGTRRLRIVGSDGNAWGQTLQGASGFDSQNVMTAVLDVVSLGITYFTVTATQTSLGALNVLNKPNTFFSLEVIQP